LGASLSQHPITQGSWNVVQVLKVDEKTRVVYFLGVGREPGRNPYFVHLYKVGLDGKHLQLLTYENATHEVSLAPSGSYFIDSYSTPDTPPITVLRDGSERLLELEKADISGLTARGWVPPTLITVKARDGSTELHGLLFKPTHFDATRRYPIVNEIYPGPQVGSVKANQNFAKNLKGHLLLVHGTLDENVPPNLTLLLTDALINANKNFDLIMLPNQHHEYAGRALAWMTRQRWDYFVRYLLGAQPPPGYELHLPGVGGDARSGARSDAGTGPAAP
jgi:dipeptidyl aminopeptidase/acylaminoacyl peptidase